MKEFENVKWGLSAGRIKLLAVIAMFIDHFAASVLLRVIRNENQPIRTWMMAYLPDYESVLSGMTLFYQLLRDIGRISFPVYCFFIVEGFFHTKSRRKYAFRLFLLALISEFPFDLALFGKISDLKHQNVYFTLLIGLAAIWGINALQKLKEERMNKYIVLFLSVIITVFSTVIAFYLKTDYSILGVLTIIMMYLVKTRNEEGTAGLISVLSAGLAVWWLFKTPADFMISLIMTMCAILVVFMLSQMKNRTYAGMLTGGIFTLCVTGMSEISALWAILFGFFYNGKKGWNSKWFFYLFYPIHLAALAMICLLMGIIKL